MQGHDLPYPIPKELLSRHLFLLVGTNPLPDWVAALTLTLPGATVWLLHSDGAGGEPSTKRQAERLETALKSKRPDLAIRLEPIPTADSWGIEKRVGDILSGKKIQGAVGLNYTGGTKPMSVHVYRALEKTLAQTTPSRVFSYLDPRRLALRIDGREAWQSTFDILKEPALRQAVEINLDDLAALHGYEPARGETWARLDDTPGLLDLCAAIARVHTTLTGVTAWHDWCFKEQCRGVPTASQYPALEPVLTALDNLCGGTGQATPERVAARLLPQANAPSLSACQKWFQGQWLEVHSLACIRQIASRFFIRSNGQGLDYRAAGMSADSFNLDVAAIVGYQLFALSCTTSKGDKEKGEAKQHLFEVYVRARQLGGDEARVGLICCVENTDRLRKEIEREWDAQGKLHVFGRHDLKDLAGALADWLQTANL